MEIVLVVLTFAPLIFILWLANLAEDEAKAVAADRLPVAATVGAAAPGGGRRAAALLTYVLVGLFYVLLIVCGVALSAIAALAAEPMADSFGAAYAELGVTPERLGRMGMGLWLPSLLGIVLLAPFARRGAGRLLPAFRPTSAVHTVALSYTALALANLLFTVGMGLGNIADMVQQAGPLNLIPSLWVQEILMAIMALIGVGWLTRRNLAQSLHRLAVVGPNARQMLIGVSVGVGLSLAVIALEGLLSAVGIVTDADVQRLSEQLLGPLVKTPFGIITLGLAAALGEETLFRGALQPRFGLIFTTLLFALLHSTYGLTLATAIVFGVGLTLGLVRQRTNTTTCIVVHALYNMTLGVISALGLLR